MAAAGRVSVCSLGAESATESLGMQRGEEGHGRCCFSHTGWEEEDERMKTRMKGGNKKSPIENGKTSTLLIRGLYIN